MPSEGNTGETSRRKFWLWACTIVFPLTLLVQVWTPELRHNYVPGVKVTAVMLQEGRKKPSDDVLNEVRSHHLLPRHWKSNEELVASAEKVLKGTVEIPGYAPIGVHLPFDPADLDHGSTAWQLEFAGLIVPEILLDAYQITGREEFYAQARDEILAWADYERKACLDRGFLWNDHAVAARVRTLADFWRIYRRRRDYREEVAQKIWGFAGRTGQLLAKPDRFTFSTNHGVMQNLALWQLCLSFPSLPAIGEFKQTAFARLKDQMTFYLGPEGVVLEHSAGYHEFGLYLAGLALRYATLLNLEVPADWRQKYERAQGFYGEILRPDRSLPLFGDAEDTKHREQVPLATFDSRGEAGPLEPAHDWTPQDSFGFYPASGYAVLWDGLTQWQSKENLSQTVLLWSYYPGHGHKHADELSVLLWAGGQDWWTNAGYWPYDDPDRHHADCWEGSNAPHLEGEACDTARTSSLSSYYHSNRFSAVEMERRGPDDFKARRLVVQVSPRTWIVADSASGEPRKKIQTIWTTAPNVEVSQEAGTNSFNLSTEGTEQVLKASVFGPTTMKTARYKGSHTPFAGWITSGGEPHPTNAILTEQPANDSWTFAIWRLRKQGMNSLSTEMGPKLLERKDDRSWRISIPSETGTVEIDRRGETISIRAAESKATQEMSGSLMPCRPAVAAQVEAVHSAFQRMASSYPRFRDLVQYRYRASLAIFCLFLLQSIVLLAWRRIMPRTALTTGLAAFLCWLALGMWLQLSYLRMT